MTTGDVLRHLLSILLLPFVVTVVEPWSLLTSRAWPASSSSARTGTCETR